jgi:putative ABC transport system substrate-binding protein
VAAFRQRLRELGWTEGQTIAVEERWAEGHGERVLEIANEFVRRKVNVIVTGGIGVPAAKRATSDIPIVFAIASDPLGSGLVTSLARPGGNVTGISNQQVELAGKRLELLREVIPGLRRLAVIVNAANSQAVQEANEAQVAARKFGLEVRLLEIQRPEDIDLAFATIKSQADAVYVVSDLLANSNRSRINTFALAARLPTMHGNRGYVETGGLISYAANYPDLFRRAAEYVDKILRGAKASDLPVEQPTKFDLTINLNTAKALGLAIPEAFLLRASEIIE